MISIKNVSKRFGSQQVLSRVSLEIELGKTTAIVGPSGTGKSVLLKILTGLIQADSGEVTINNESMTGCRSGEERRRICSKMGVLFQGAALFDSMTIYDNVAFPLRERRELSEREIVRRTTQRLEEVGLRNYAWHYPGEVSIGMRKRVGIARALVIEPETILFDEPNTGLDPQVGQEIYELIRETQKGAGFTGIVVSHEIPEVFQICDRVAMLYQGVIQEEGSVEAFVRSKNPVVEQFSKGEIDGPIQIN